MMNVAHWNALGLWDKCPLAKWRAFRAKPPQIEPSCSTTSTDKKNQIQSNLKSFLYFITKKYITKDWPEFGKQKPPREKKTRPIPVQIRGQKDTHTNQVFPEV